MVPIWVAVVALVVGGLVGIAVASLCAIIKISDLTLESPSLREDRTKQVKIVN